MLLNYNLKHLYNCIISIIYLVMHGLKWYHFIKPWDISAGLMIRLSDELNIRLALPWGKCEDVSGSVSTNFLHIMFRDKYSSCARVSKQKRLLCVVVLFLFVLIHDPMNVEWRGLIIVSASLLLVVPAQSAVTSVYFIYHVSHVKDIAVIIINTLQLYDFAHKD